MSLSPADILKQIVDDRSFDTYGGLITGWIVAVIDGAYAGSSSVPERTRNYRSVSNTPQVIDLNFNSIFYYSISTQTFHLKLFVNAYQTSVCYQLTVTFVRFLLSQKKKKTKKQPLVISPRRRTCVR